MTGRPRLVLSPEYSGGVSDIAPPYVPEIGQELWDGTKVFRESCLYGFVVPAKQERLRDFCRLTLRSGGSGDSGWQPEGDHILVTFERFTLGGDEQHAAAIWFPVVCGEQRAWAMPYLLVDSPSWLCQGRETFGLPGQLGAFQWAPKEGRLKVSAQTLKAFDSDEQATYRDVLALKWTPGSLPPSIGSVDPAPKPDDPAFIRHRLAHDVGHGRVPFVLLRQYRHVATPRLACYQRVLRLDRVAHPGGVATDPDGDRPSPPPPPFDPSATKMNFAKLDGQAFDRVLGVTVSPVGDIPVHPDDPVPVPGADKVPGPDHVPVHPDDVPIPVPSVDDVSAVDAFMVRWSYRLAVAPSDDDSGGPHGAGRTYAERGGEIVYRQPSVATQARMYAFLVRSDKAKVDRFCETTINRPSRGGQHWTAYSADALVTVVDVESMSSEERLDRPLGSVKEKEFAVWVPVKETATHRLAWVIPYMVVDNHLALCGGREGFGFPKRLGQVTIQDAAADQSSFRHPHSFGVYDHPRAGEPGEPGELLASVRLVGSAPDELRRRWDQGEAHRMGPAFANHFGGRLAGGVITTLIGGLRFVEHAAVQVAEQFAEGHIPFLMLHQFPAAAAPASACVQALVEVDTVMTDFHQGGFLDGTWVVDLGDNLGPMLDRGVGLQRAQAADLAFWLDIDFSCRIKDVLYQWQRG